MIALGLSPKKVGFSENMLLRKKRKLYAIFNDKKKVKDSAYGQSDTAYDEQLLAFTLSAKRGVKGELISEFVRVYGREGRMRLPQLRKKYFGIHTTDTLTY